MSKNISTRMARAVQAATGQSYQRCLQWVRNNHDAIRERTGSLIPEKGLNEAARVAAVELARIDGFAGAEEETRKP